MFKNLLIFSFVFALSTTAFAQNKSIYTDLTAEKCKTADVDKGMTRIFGNRRVKRARLIIF